MPEPEVREPPPGEADHAGTGAGVMVGVVLALVAVLLVILFAVGALESGTDADAEAPGIDLDAG